MGSSDWSINSILIGEFREDENSVSQDSQDMAGQMFMVPGKAWFIDYEIYTVF